ncbi:MAG: hypothetical protein L0Y55_02830 [Anaerolineales bacterium]|nr:hypothetical protein [Anaerolineales bacterium]
MSEENTKQTKKEWTKPELLVLVRSKPEEAVLGFCKGGSFATSPFPDDSNCIGDGNGRCTACNTTSAS